VLFDEFQCTVETARTNDIVLHGSRLDDAYAMNLDHISPMDLSFLKTSLDDARRWHCILESASMYTFYKLVKHDLVRGLPLYKYEKDHVCSACIRGKQVRASFKPLKSMSTPRRSELLHIDQCEPIRIIILGGNSYIFVIVEDYSRLTQAIFLKDKIEALKEFTKMCRKL